MDACSSVARSRQCRRGSPVPASSRLRTRSAGGSLHDCRRSYVTALLAAGNTIAVVQKLAGHADEDAQPACDAARTTVL
jgi:integrase